MPPTRKHELMLQTFGVCEGYTCRECSNFLHTWYHDKRLYKCDVYGNTRSAASDWAGRWLACGMFNKPYTGRPIIETVKHTKDKLQDDPIEGQTGLW